MDTVPCLSQKPGWPDVFCSCDLDLDPMTLIYDLDLYLLKMYLHTRKEVHRWRLSIVIV